MFRYAMPFVILICVLSCSKDEEEPASQVSYSTEICEYIKILPNPADDILFINVDLADSTRSSLTINMFNAGNELIVMHQINEFNGMAKEQIDVNSVDDGRYRVQVVWMEKECNQFIEVI